MPRRGLVSGSLGSGVRIRGKGNSTGVRQCFALLLLKREFWRSIAGGFSSSDRLKRLGRLLLDDAETALQALQDEVTAKEGVYLLICLDDLARVEEMSRLTGLEVPLEVKTFPFDGDVHGVVISVRHWAAQGEGTGSYLVRPLSKTGSHVQAWRITDQAFEASLLARVLPFTSSLDRPLKNARLVYQSDWVSYLSIYELSPHR